MRIDLNTPKMQLGYPVQRLFTTADLFMLQTKIDELEERVSSLPSLGHDWLRGGIQLMYDHSLPYAMLHLLPERLAEDREEQVLETLHQQVIDLLDLYDAYPSHTPFYRLGWDERHKKGFKIEDNAPNLAYLGHIKLLTYILEQVKLVDVNGRDIIFDADDVFENAAWLKEAYPFLYPDYYWSAKQ